MLYPKADFVGLGNTIHLAAGGETPMLASHRDAIEEFMTDKAAGMPGRERFFAKHLVDYDFAQNFGNWCWVASVLPFSQAPFRRLDAEIQAKKFDKNGAYVNKWLPNRKEDVDSDA
jgi:hypothetical protein